MDLLSPYLNLLYVWLFFTTVSLLMKFTTVNSSDYLFTPYNCVPWKKQVIHHTPWSRNFSKMRNCKVSPIILRKAQIFFHFLSGYRKTFCLAKFFSHWKSSFTAWRKLCQYSEKNLKQCQSSCLGLIVIYRSLDFTVAEVFYSRKIFPYIWDGLAALISW